MISLNEQLTTLRQQHAQAAIQFACTCDDLMAAEERLELLLQERKLQRARLHDLGQQIQAQIAAQRAEPAADAPAPVI